MLKALNFNCMNLYDRVDSFSPDLIGITCPTPVYYIVKEICNELKEKDSKVIIVLGGPHPTALPRETIEDIKTDFIVIGEGEETFIELVDHINNLIIIKN